MIKKRNEIRIGGTGGQGILTTGLLLGEAAALYDHKYAVQTQSYGPESRGGASKTDVIISAEEIDYPEILAPDLVAVLSKEAYCKYADLSDPSILRILDSSAVAGKGGIFQPPSYVFPICEVALKELGSGMTANIILLGLIVGISRVVSLPAAELAVETRFAKKNPALNLKALRTGFSMASIHSPFREGRQC
jgi:2-oxoglutarate ferredoxin oxidoreductase subunit gamma